MFEKAAETYKKKKTSGGTMFQKAAETYQKKLTGEQVEESPYTARKYNLKPSESEEKQPRQQSAAVLPNSNAGIARDYVKNRGTDKTGTLPFSQTNADSQKSANQAFDALRTPVSYSDITKIYFNDKATGSHDLTDALGLKKHIEMMGYDLDAAKKELDSYGFTPTSEYTELESKVNAGTATDEERLRYVELEHDIGLDTLKRSEENEQRQEELRSKIAEVEAYRNAYQKQSHYQEIPKANDYAEKSKFDPSMQYDPEKEYYNAIAGTYTDTGYKDILYAYINQDKNAQARQDFMDVGSPHTLASTTHSYWKDLPDDVIGTFNYIYATEGAEAAYEYIDYAVNKTYTGSEAIALGLLSGSGILSTSAALDAGLAHLMGNDDNVSKARDSYVEMLKDMEGAAQEHPYLHNSFSAAGTLAMLLSISKGAGAIKAFSGLPQIAKSILTSAISFGGSTAVQEIGGVATGLQDIGSFGKDVLKSSAAGAAGGAASGGIAAAGSAFLKSHGLANNILANTVVAGLSGSGFSLGNQGVMQGIELASDPEHYELDGWQIAQDALVGFAFSAISFLSQNYINFSSSTSAPAEDVRPKSEYFDGIDDLDDLTAEYRRLAKQWHPDKFATQGDAAVAQANAKMAEINAQYEQVKSWLAVHGGASAYATAKAAKSNGDTAAYEAAQSDFSKSVRALIEISEAGGLTQSNAQDALQILEAVAASGISGGIAAGAMQSGTSLASAMQTAKDVTAPKQSANDALIAAAKEMFAEESAKADFANKLATMDKWYENSETNQSVPSKSDLLVVQKQDNTESAAPAGRTSLSDSAEISGSFGNSGIRQAYAAMLAQSDAEIIKANNIAAVKESAALLGTNGAKVLTDMYSEDLSASAYIISMTSYYNAGKKGASMDSVNASDMLTEPMREAAYLAGQMDAAPTVKSKSESDNLSLAKQSDGGYNETITENMTREDDKYGADAAKTISSGTNTEYDNTLAEADDGRKVHLRDGGERSGGENTGKQVRGLEEGTGRNQSGQTKSKPRDSEAASLTLGKEVSTSSFYIPGGSTTDKIYRIASGETTAMKRANELASERGLNVVFFAGGNLSVNGKPARGYISGKNVVIRADDPNFTADQIMRHEIGHDKIAKGEIDINTVKDMLKAIYGEETVDFICQQYVESYEGSNLTPDEVFEEMVCDSLGNMNIFDSKSEIKEAADNFLATTKAVTEASMQSVTNPDAVVEGKASINTNEENNDGKERSVNRAFERTSESREAKIEQGEAEKNGKAISNIRERQRGIDYSFGAKPNLQWVDGNVVVPSAQSVEYAEQAIAAEYGIASFVIRKDICDLKRKSQAFCCKNQIYFCEQMSEEFRGMAAMHEITHVMCNLRFEPYMKFLKNASGAFNFASVDTKEMVARVAKHINYSPNLLVTKPAYVKERVLDELCAMIYGHISAARSGNLTYEQITEGDRILQSALNDSDSFLAELTEIHRQFKESNSCKASHVIPSDRTSKPLTAEQKEIWKRVQKMTPMQIASLSEKDASTTPSFKPYAKSGIDKESGKESKFYGSAEKSSNVMDETRRLIQNMDDIKYYSGVANLDLLNAANERLNLGGSKEALRWTSIDADEATAEDVALGFILLKRYQDAGMYEEAANVVRHLREMGTKAGQKTQAFSLLGRMTPEGMEVYAQKELDHVRNEMIRQYGEAWVEQRKAMFELTADECDRIKSLMTEASNLPNGRDKTICIAKIAAILNDKIPSGIWMKLKSSARVNMLLNSKTMIRNILGNACMMPVYAVQDFTAAGIDKAFSLKTGIRTTGALPTKSAFSAAKRGLFESFEDFRLRINTRDVSGDRFEVGSAQAFHHYAIAEIKAAVGKNPIQTGAMKVGMSLSNALNMLDRVTNFLLDAGDRPFFEYHFIKSINNQVALNHVSEPTPEMIEIATAEALARTWQDDNAYTKAVSKIRSAINLLGSQALKIGSKDAGIGDSLMPFIKTPANLAKALIEYSPAGLLNSTSALIIKSKMQKQNGKIDAKTQKAAVDALSKMIAGTILMLLFGALAKKGLLTGGNDDKDKDLASFEQNIMGVAPYSVVVNGKSYTYDWAQPIGGLAAISADIAQNSVGGQTIANVLLNGISTGGNVLFEQSFLKGISELFGEAGLVPGLMNALSGSATQLVPSALSQIAQLADPVSRSSYEYKDLPQTTINKIRARVPGLRNALVPVVDVLGHDVLSYGGDNNMFNVFINPANVYSKTENAVAEEIYRVYGETGDATIIPRVAPYYIEKNDIRYNFTAEERAAYQRTAGQTNEKIVANLLKHEGYSALDDNEKAKVLNLAVGFANAKAKYTYLQTQDIEYERMVWMVNAENGESAGVSVADYLLAKAATAGIKKGIDGKTYSKSYLIMEALYDIPGMNLMSNDSKREYLFEAFGVSEKVRHYSKAKVSEELEKMRAEADMSD